jgi:hypothetical protein
LHIPDLLVHDFRLFLQSIPGLSNLPEIRLTLGKTMENSLSFRKLLHITGQAAVQKASCASGGEGKPLTNQQGCGCSIATASQQVLISKPAKALNM